MSWSRGIALRAVAEVTLGRQRSPEHDIGPFMVKYLRAANVKDGRMDLSDVKSMNFSPHEQRVFSLAPGDVLVTEGSGSLSSVGASAVWVGNASNKETICFQNTLLRMRPRRELINGRFLGWWARSAFGSGVFSSLASGANIYHLSAERVRALRIDLPTLEEQRRIADYLDAQTEHMYRIDNIRMAQETALIEREHAATDGLFSQNSSGKTIRLKYLLSNRPRYGVLVPEFTGAGVPFIRVNDLLDLEARLPDLPMIPPELSAKYPRTVVRPGDLLLSVVGTLGRATIATTASAGANIARAVCSMRLKDRTAPELVQAWLNTTEFEMQALMATSSDTAQPTLGMEDLANFRLTWPMHAAERKALLVRAKRIRVTTGELRDRLDGQRRLLAERRRALISATVTGQIDVSTASGRGIEDGLI